jgi:hypothetical protein
MMSFTEDQEAAYRQGDPMVNAYNLLHAGRRLGLTYVAPHPTYPDHLLVSVIPLECAGKWEDPSLGIHFEGPLHDIVPDTEDEVDAVKNLIARAAIAARDVQIEPQSEPAGLAFVGAGAGSAAASVVEGLAPADDEQTLAPERGPAEALPESRQVR